MKNAMDNGQWITGKIVFAFFLFSCSSSIVHAYTFPRDLTLGSQGEDVRQLQIELNKNPSTQVAYSGVGSPGQETDYFGPKTQAAVIRYQNLHAQKILIPMGLSRGTGYVGASTRAELSGVSDIITTPAVDFLSIVNLTKASVPKTQGALEGSIKDFAGTDNPTEEDIREYSRSMVLASQGYSQPNARQSSTVGTTTPLATNSKSASTGSTGSNSNNGTASSTQPTRADADGESGLSTAGCIDLFLELIGL